MKKEKIKNSYKNPSKANALNVLYKILIKKSIISEDEIETERKSILKK